LLEFGFAAIAVFVAAYVQGLIGFGSGMISITLLALLWEVQDVVAITAAFSIVMCFYLAWRLRSHISLHEIWPMMLGASVGIPIGVIALTSLDPRFIKGSLGAFLVLYSTWSLWARASSGEKISRFWALPAGFFGGILSGAFNTGGPPVVLYGTERQWSPNSFRGNVQGMFAPCSVLTLSLLSYKGVVNAESLAWNFKLLPFLIAGMALGDRRATGVDDAHFRRMLLFCLLGIGLVFLRSFTLPAPDIGQLTLP
jgi:uncharacterized membrane protein YfcA